MRASSDSASASSAALLWARTYLPHYFEADSCEFHHELMRDLEQDGKRRLARVAPRGHAKSTCATLAFPLWCICEQKRSNIVIVTHERSLATQFVRDIRNELEQNERILATYGDLCRPQAKPQIGRGIPVAASEKKAKERKRGAGRAGTSRSKRTAPAAGDSVPLRASRRKWAEDVLTTSSGVTLHGRGSGASFRGIRVGPHRPDLIICDDLEKDEQVRSPQRRAKLEQWLRRVVIPALSPGGRLLVVGSILHYDSLLAGLRDPQRWPGWDYRIYRALEAEPLAKHSSGQRACAAERDDARFQFRALWPAVWPVERLLAQRKEIGTIAFEQEYQANPIDDTLRVFRPEWLRRCSASELAPLEQQGRLVNLIAVDPATGTAGGDYFAMWIGAVDTASGVIYTRELRLERIGIVQQVRQITQAFERYRPVRIGIETVAYQAALQQVLEEHGRRSGVYLPVVAINTIANKRARIEGAACFFENGTFRLPESLDAEAEAQFLQFPKSRYDDAPDVCAMAIDLARGLRGIAVGHQAAVRGNGNPFRRGGGW